ncbi:hypothetical protein ABT224_11175 [Streptomyces sp. NPDC001584]|uniref:hypothetical protein n=1 Tax=Streptomyces sp. NPDC001584 TaxID=3154521 RepID=UPI00332E2434
MAAASLDNGRYSRAKEDHGDEESLDVFDVILQQTRTTPSSKPSAKPWHCATASWPST